MDITKNDIIVTKIDLSLFTTIILSTHFIKGIYDDTYHLYNIKWMVFAMASLFGIILHSLITHKISHIINTKHTNIPVKQSIYDIIKFTTIFSSQILISNNMSYDIWLIKSSLTIGSYVLYNFLFEKIRLNFSPLIDDILKTCIASLITDIIIDDMITMNHMLSILTLIPGFIIFHLIIKKFIDKNDYIKYNSTKNKIVQK